MDETAPLIDSIVASTGSFASPRRRTSAARPSGPAERLPARSAVPARRRSIKAFAAQIQSDVQHARPPAWACDDERSCSPRRPSFMRFSRADMPAYRHCLRPCLAPPIAPDRRVIILNRVLRPPSEDGAIFAAMDGEQISRLVPLLKLGGLLAGATAVGGWKLSEEAGDGLTSVCSGARTQLTGPMLTAAGPSPASSESFQPPTAVAPRAARRA